LRQALSFGLLVAHLAFISFSRSTVSFILDGLADGAEELAPGVGVDVWADAPWIWPATSITAKRQTKIRSNGIPRVIFLNEQQLRGTPFDAARAPRV
jgi:hypothetical protein